MNTAGNAQIKQCPNCGAKNRVAAVAGQSGREAVCGRCKTSLSGAADATATSSSSSHPLILTDKNFADQVEKFALPVLVDFWAAWCGPCRMIAPVIEQLAQQLSGRARVGKLDVDQNQMTAARFRVQSIPTLLIFKDGREVDRIVGAQSGEAIMRRLQAFI